MTKFELDKIEEGGIALFSTFLSNSNLVIPIIGEKLRFRILQWNTEKFEFRI
jgi:hypothetical protein